MFRRDFVLDRYGGYDPAFRYSQDYDLWSKMAWHGRIVNLPEVLNYWRVHATATSSTLLGSIKEIEPLRTSYANVRRLGFEIGEEDWRRVRNIYGGTAAPANHAELLETIDTLYQVADRFLFRYAGIGESDHTLNRWVRDDITKRFLIRLEKLRSQGERGLVLGGLVRLARHNPRTLRLGRWLTGRLIFGADNYSRLRNLRLAGDSHSNIKTSSSATRSME